MQPTASKAHLLLECSRPFDPSVVTENETSPAAQYGTDFHAQLALKITGQPLTCSGALLRHVESSWVVLEAWLKREGYLADGDIVLVEQSFALNVVTLSARRCAPSNENHVYPDLGPDEIACTVDLGIVPDNPDKPILVEDHKSGSTGDFSNPWGLPQITVCALALGYMYSPGSCTRTVRFTRTVQTAILHSPKDGAPMVFSGSPRDIEDIRNMNVLDSLSRAVLRIGDGSMRPGKWCDRCPARSTCPAQSYTLLAEAGHLLEKASVVGSELVLVGKDQSTLSVEERVGRLHLLLTRFRELDKAASAEIRGQMEADPGLEPIRPDGKRLVFEEKRVENLSKASILRGLGPERGEKIIQELREAGAVEISVRKELRAK